MPTSISSTSSLLYPALVSSVIENCITHPIDVIKIHKQTANSITYNFKTLYKGFIPRAIGNIPSRSIFLFSQDYLQNCIVKFNNDDTNFINNKHYKINKIAHSILIPFCSGLAQTLVDTPIEILKMNQIMNIKTKNLYKGFIPHFGRNFIFVFFVYNFKQFGGSNGVSSGGSSGVSNGVSSGSNHSYLKTAFYGATGGLVGAYVSHPLDTIKTCIQTNRNYDYFKPKDYMRGCHLRAGMGMINIFISLYVFEMMKHY